MISFRMLFIYVICFDLLLRPSITFSETAKTNVPNSSFSRLPGLVIKGQMDVETFNSYLNEAEKNRLNLSSSELKSLDRYKKYSTLAGKIKKCLTENGVAEADLNSQVFLKGLIEKDCFGESAQPLAELESFVEDVVEANNQVVEKPKNFNSEKVAKQLYERSREKLITSYWAVELSIGKDELPSSFSDILKPLYGDKPPPISDPALQKLLPLIKENIDKVKTEDKRSENRKKVYGDLSNDLKKFRENKANTEIHKDNLYTQIELIENYISAYSPINLNASKIRQGRSTTSEPYGGYRAKIHEIFPNGNLPRECEELPLEERLPCLYEKLNRSQTPQEEQKVSIKAGKFVFSDTSRKDNTQYFRTNQDKDDIPLEERIERLRGHSKLVSPDFFERSILPFLDSHVYIENETALKAAIEANEIKTTKLEPSPIIRGSALATKKDESKVTYIKGLNPINAFEYGVGAAKTSDYITGFDTGRFPTDAGSFDEYLKNFYSTFQGAIEDLEELKADEFDKGEYDSFIENMLYNNPELAGEYIAANPQHASYICQLLTKVTKEKNADEEARQKRLKFVKIGTLIAGVLLIVATLGTAVPGVAAAVAGTAGLSVATLNTTLAVSSIALAAASATTGFYESAQIKKNTDLATQNLVIKGIGDAKEIQSLVNQANGAFAYAVADVALLPFDAVTLRHGLSQLDDLATLRKVASSGGEDLPKFLKEVRSKGATVDSDLYRALKKEGFSDDQIIDYYKKSGASPQEIYKVSENSLKAKRVSKDQELVSKVKQKLANGDELKKSEKIIADLTDNGRISLEEVVKGNSKLSLSKRKERLKEFFAKRGKTITDDQLSAFEAAHNFGDGSLYKYSNLEIDEKIKILRDAKFSPEEIYFTLKSGLAGEAKPGLFAKLFGSGNSTPSNLPTGTSELGQKAYKIKQKLSTAKGKKAENLNTQLEGLKKEILTENGIPRIDTRNPTEELYKQLKKLGPDANLFDPNATKFVELLDSLDPTQRARVLRSSHRRHLLQQADVFNKDTLLKEVLSQELNDSTKFTRNFHDVEQFEISPSHAKYLEDNVLSEIFPQEIFPPGSVKMTDGKLQIDSSLIKGDKEKALDIISRFRNRLDDAYRNYTGQADFYEDLIKEFEIEKPGLLLDLKRDVVGDLKIPAQTGSKSSDFALVQALQDNGIKYSYSPDGQSINIKAADLTDEQLELVTKSKSNQQKTKSKTDVPYQEAFTEPFYEYQHVKKRLGNNAKWVPDDLNTSLYREKDGLAKEGFEKIEFPDSAVGFGNQRTAFRDSKSGVSYLEIRDSSGELKSVEVIVSRDVSDSSKGVEFFSYGSNSKLSNRFHVRDDLPSRATGRGCMDCHTARKLDGNLISTFAPFTLRESAQPKKPHPSVEEANLKNIDIE